MGGNKYILSSVDNTLQLIELLMEHEELSLAEISRETGFGKASLFRMLATLENREFVNKTDQAKYSLGIKFARIGNLVMERQNIVNVARPYLKKMIEEYNETIHFNILAEDREIVVMEKLHGNSTIQMGSRVGSKMRAYATGTGKMLLSCLDDEEIESYLNQVDFQVMTNNTIVDKAEFRKELEKIQEQGYSEDMEESEVGLICFAAPVRDLTGKAIAAISISGPSVRMRMNREAYTKAIVETAKQISKNFGYIEE
jgi:DNA-binding IclR family transcriptional regulator